MSAPNLERITEMINQLSEEEQQKLIEHLAQQLRHARDQDKMAMMRAAATDPLFLADLNEVAEDFRDADLDEYGV